MTPKRSKNSEFVALEATPNACWVARKDDHYAMVVRTVIWGLPVTRRLGVRGGHLYVTADYRQYKDFVRGVLRDTVKARWGENYPLTLRPETLSVSLAIWARPDTRLDLDNALKPIVDAAAGVWGLDDTIAVVRLASAVYHGEQFSRGVEWLEDGELRRSAEWVDAHEVSLLVEYAPEHNATLAPYADPPFDWGV